MYVITYNFPNYVRIIFICLTIIIQLRIISNLFEFFVQVLSATVLRVI